MSLCARGPCGRVRWFARHGSSWPPGSRFRENEPHPPGFPAAADDTRIVLSQSRGICRALSARILLASPLTSYPRQDQESAIVDDPIASCIAAARRSSRSRRPAPASSRPARSRADRPTPAPDGAPSSAGARRTARDIRDSDTVPPARATGGSPLGLPPRPTPGLALAGGACDGRRLATSLRYVRASRTPPAQLPHLGKLQEAFGLESLQQLPALVVLQPSIGPCPLQQLADGARDLGHPEGGKLRAVWRINSSSLGTNVRPQKVRDSGMRWRMARFSPRRAQCPGSRRRGARNSPHAARESVLCPAASRCAAR